MSWPKGVKMRALGVVGTAVSSLILLGVYILSAEWLPEHAVLDRPDLSVWYEPGAPLSRLAALSWRRGPVVLRFAVLVFSGGAVHLMWHMLGVRGWRREACMVIYWLSLAWGLFGHPLSSFLIFTYIRSDPAAVSVMYRYDFLDYSLGFMGYFAGGVLGGTLWRRSDGEHA